MSTQFFIRPLGFTLLFFLQSMCASVHEGIFREYDIRGKVGTEFSPEDTYAFAQAIGVYFRAHGHVEKIAIGMDGRIHSPEIKKHITNALLDSGFDVIFIGTCTTPVMFFTMHNLDVDAGLMITASHNPAEYNGIKICLGKETVFGDGIREIRQLYASGKSALSTTPGMYSEHDMVTPYIDWLTNHFSHLKGMTMAAIVDCGNGAGGIVMPRLIEKMQWPNVKLLFAEVDGSYPNHVADPTVEKYMQSLKQALKESDANLGIGLDGDADRMAAMTKVGKLITGDRLLSIFAKPMVEKAPKSSIVFDVSSSLGLTKVLKSWGATPVMARTGISHIKSAMKAHHALLGGEVSCHFVFKDRNFGFDDGIYAALRLFEILHENNTTLNQVLRDFPQTVSSPTYRIPCEDPKRLTVVEALQNAFSTRNHVEMVTIDGVRINFQNGWGIVRLSNTEPLLSMRFEGFTEEDLKKITEEFASIICAYIDCAFMK